MKNIFLVSVLLFLVILAFPINAQKIPDVFWNSNLSFGNWIFGIKKEIQVKYLFQNPKFKIIREEQLDGTVKVVSSKMISQTIKGNDVFITINTYLGKNLNYSVIWQLRYDKNDNYTVIQSIDVNVIDNMKNKYNYDDFKIDGDLIKKYYNLVAQFFSGYYDKEEILNKMEE
jgi:hypothetical protein